MATTKPGSRAHRLVQLIRALTEELGRGVEVGEIRDAYESRTDDEPPDSLTAEISSLKRRGILEVVGGRPGHSLYAPADSDLDFHHRQDDGVVLVLKALRSAFEREKRPLATREVQQEVERRDGHLDSDNPDVVRRHLHTLTRRRERGPEEFQKPQAIKFSTTTTAGFDAAYWVPAGEELPDDWGFAPRSVAEALRRAVVHTTGELGRPISRRELLWWLDGPGAEHPAGEMLQRERLGTDLSETRRNDAEHRGEDGWLHIVSNRLTCYGGPWIRYSSGPPADEAASVGALEDACAVLQLDDELWSLRGLETQVQMDVKPEPFITLVDARRSAITETLQEATADADPSRLLDQARAANRCLRGWVEGASLTDGQREDRRVAHPVFWTPGLLNHAA